MRQVEVSGAIVFDDGAGARAFFGALIAGTIGPGRPENVEMLFGRAPKGRTGRPPKSPWPTGLRPAGTRSRARGPPRR
jgi:hypothetical protein